MKKPKTITLTPPFAENIGGVPWLEYPRPSLARESYLSLNGSWELEAEDYRGSVLVPFPPESLLSGGNGTRILPTGSIPFFDCTESSHSPHKVCQHSRRIEGLG